MPLLVASQPDEEVIVFYTQKSPHMNYENVRLLKETDKEAKFIKCFEGSNALDFQLVTQLGYLLCESQENSYVIISNDTGFDAAVRYWKQRNMPVQRLSGKELNRRLQQKLRPDGEKANAFEAEREAAVDVPGILENEVETVSDEEKVTVETNDAAEVETAEIKEAEHIEKNEEVKEQTESGEIQMEIPDEIIKPDETEDTSQPIELENAETDQKISDPDELQELLSETLNEIVEAVPKTEISKEQDEVIRSLLTCISKDRLADFHNALVLFFGEETGKELYQEAKNSSAYAICRVNQTAISEEEKFDVYCQTVFAYSDPKLDCPEDFSSFLYKANAKRKNLNSLRAALQGHYGKDKGMKYYSLFKSHIKIMNRM